MLLLITSSIIHLIIFLVILGLAYWAVDKIAVSPPFSTLIKGILIVIAVVLVINALMGLMGKSFIQI